MDLQAYTSGDNAQSYIAFGRDHYDVFGDKSTGVGFFLSISNNFFKELPFEIEKKYFQELLRNKNFMKKYEGEYIAIKNNETLGIDSSFSKLAKKIFRTPENRGKAYIALLSYQEQIAHFGSPFEVKV